MLQIDSVARVIESRCRGQRAKARPYRYDIPMKQGAAVRERSQTQQAAQVEDEQPSTHIGGPSPSTWDGSGAAGSCALTTRRLCAGLALLKGLSRAAREPRAVLIVAAAILIVASVSIMQGMSAEINV